MQRVTPVIQPQRGLQAAKRQRLVLLFQKLHRDYAILASRDDDELRAAK